MKQIKYIVVFLHVILLVSCEIKLTQKVETYYDSDKKKLNESYNVIKG